MIQITKGGAELLLMSKGLVLLQLATVVHGPPPVLTGRRGRGKPKKSTRVDSLLYRPKGPRDRALRLEIKPKDGMKCD